MIMTTETSNTRVEWVLVPRDPSAGMWDSAEKAMIESECAYNAGDQDARSDAHGFPTMRIWQDVVGYRAMLAAAPQHADARPLDRLLALDVLVDRIAEAIRDGAGLAEGDPPWESLGEERRAPWRADAKRALSVIKEFLTAERGSGVGGPDVQAAEAPGVVDDRVESILHKLNEWSGSPAPEAADSNP